MAKVQEIGPYSAYAISVKYGYQGTEEEWVKEQEANRKAAEAAAAAAAQSAKDAAASASGAAQSGQQAVQSIKDAQTAAEQAIDTAKQQAVQAAQAEAEKAATSAGQAASSAAEAAQSATNAAAEVGKVQNAGTTAVQAVQAAQNTATGAVASAQQTATQAVSQAQTTAVSAVQAEGTKQTNAVAAAASSALKGISDAKDAALSNVAEAGEAQVSAVGTAGTSAVQDVNDAKTAALEEIDAASAALPSPAQSDAGKVPTVKADGSAYELAGPYAPLSAAIRPTASGNPVSITDSAEWPMQGLKVYGKSTQNGTPSPESPVPIVSAGASGSIETIITGKNLLTGRLYYGMYSNGFSFIQNEDVVSLPYKTNSELMGICYAVPVKKGVTYTFSVTNPNANANLLLALYRTFEDTKDYRNAISKVEGGSSNSISITPSEDGILVCLIAGPWTDGTTTIHECTASELLQLEVGSTDTAYEAPHAQSIVVTTPNGLPGIPVDSGGNYTDASGKQWVCDAVDYETQKYIQNCVKVVFDGSDDENWASRSTSVTSKFRYGIKLTIPPARVESPSLIAVAMCDKFLMVSANDTYYAEQGAAIDNNGNLMVFCDAVSTGNVTNWKNWLKENLVTLIYQIATPITTPLSPEELAAYRALHTYDGTTVISTPEDVTGIEVRYVADGEKYIDRKISEAIASAAATQLASYDALSGAIREGVNEA